MTIEIQHRARILLEATAHVVRRLRTDEALAVSVFVLGLWLDRQWPVAGQLATSALAWAVFVRLADRAEGDVRLRLWFCLVWATVGEIFCSLVWGLYTYRLENIPSSFRPVMCCCSGWDCASRRVVAAWADRLTSCFCCRSDLGAVGLDRFSLLLLLTFTACSIGPAAAASAARIHVLGGDRARAIRHRARSWRWAPVTPVLDLVTTNPPFAAGAFYCMLDAVVMITLAVQRARPTGQARRVPGAMRDAGGTWSRDDGSPFNHRASSA